MIVIPYEELAKKLQEIRAKLARFLGLAEQGELIKIDTREHHLVAGNPMRYKGQISIRYDDSWKNVLEGGIIDKINTMKVEFAPILKELQEISWEGE